MNNENHNVFATKDRKKMLNKTIIILSGSIILAFLINFGFLISEIIGDSLNQAKTMTYLYSVILLSGSFVIVRRIK